MNNFIVATIKDKEIPSAEDIAAYVESLKLHLSRGQIKDPGVAEQIEKLPAPKQILRSFSIEEIRVLTEAVGYLWEKITGANIIEESKMKHAPEFLNGCYWMLTKGVILEGVNHYTIIKQNISLFCSLLNINAFAMHDRLASNPNDVIKLVLDNGGMRIFVSPDKEAFFQLSSKTYSEWGRQKIKKYDFKKKTTIVIDTRQPYSGWKSGIRIII